MEITVRDEERDPDLRVRWYEGTSTFHIDVALPRLGTFSVNDDPVDDLHYRWQEVAVQTHYGDDKGNPPDRAPAVLYARDMLTDGSARELTDAEIAAR